MGIRQTASNIQQIRKYSFFPQMSGGCQMVRNLSLGLCDWGLTESKNELCNIVNELCFGHFQLFISLIFNRLFQWWASLILVFPLYRVLCHKLQNMSHNICRQLRFFSFCEAASMSVISCALPNN